MCADVTAGGQGFFTLKKPIYSVTVKEMWQMLGRCSKVTAGDQSLSTFQTIAVYVQKHSQGADWLKGYPQACAHHYRNIIKQQSLGWVKY